MVLEERASLSESKVNFEGWKDLHYREGQPGDFVSSAGVAEIVAIRMWGGRLLIFSRSAQAEACLPPSAGQF